MFNTQLPDKLAIYLCPIFPAIGGGEYLTNLGDNNQAITKCINHISLA